MALEESKGSKNITERISGKDIITEFQTRFVLHKGI